MEDLTPSKSDDETFPNRGRAVSQFGDMARLHFLRGKLSQDQVVSIKRNAHYRLAIYRLGSE